MQFTYPCVRACVCVCVRIGVCVCVRAGTPPGLDTVGKIVAVARVSFGCRSAGFDGERARTLALATDFDFLCGNICGVVRCSPSQNRAAMQNKFRRRPF